MARSWVVYWTWEQSKPVSTKKEGMSLCRAWKERYEAKGWTVHATKGLFPGFNAFSPEYRHEDYNTHGPDAPSHTIIVCELDERGEVIMPTYKPKAEPKPKDPNAPKRRGKSRKPIGA